MAKKKSKCSVLFLPMQANIEFDSEESLLELAIEHKVEIANSCGGMGTCGTCRVEIESSIVDLPARNEIEQELASDRGFKPEIRLACQLAPQAGLVARICLVLEESDESDESGNSDES